MSPLKIEVCLDFLTKSYRDAFRLCRRITVEILKNLRLGSRPDRMHVLLAYL